MGDTSWTRVPKKGDIPSHLLFNKPLEKPDLDEREYRVIKLDNGLQALLIHDAKTDKAAAAMDVGVGNLSDPDDMPGLAHFCEHLLFMGTKEFPEESEYSQFIKSHGGSTNAYTSTSNTCYYFSIGAAHLPGGIDRFSGFFHSPLFDPSCTTRELNAVDSEHKKNAQSDVFRLWQIFKQQAIPGHPWSKFGTGSLITLTEAARKLQESQDAASTSLVEQEGDGGFVGRETRRRLIEWWKVHYSAHIMNLVMLGRESLDELTSIALSKFSAISSHDLPWPTETIPWGPDQTGNITFAKSVMDVDTMELAFPIGRQDVNYEHKPATFLAHFIGHEGQGSLFSYLKEKGWVTQLWSGPQNSGRGFGFMKINVKLTKSGFQNYRLVLEAMYSYISLLRSTDLPPWAFDEFRSLGEIGFRFMAKLAPEGYSSRLAELMARPWPRERLISASQKVWTENHDLLRNMLEVDMAPENGSVLLCSKDFTAAGVNGPWLNEKWYGTEYLVQKLDPSLLKMAKAENAIKELSLPPRNEFIPKDLHVDRKEVLNPAKRPALIRQTEKSHLWYKKDDQFWLPKGYIGVYFRSPITYASSKSIVMTKLMECLITDALTEYAYDAALAGLNYTLTFDEDGNMILQTGGYTDKMLALLQHLLETARSHQVREDRLEVFKEEVAQAFENLKKNDPYAIAQEWMEYTFRDYYRTGDELLQFIPSITSKDVQDHMAEIFSRARVSVLVTGNFYPNDAIKAQDLVEKTLAARPIQPSEGLDRTTLLPVGGSFIYNKALDNPLETNNAVEYILQIHDSTNELYARLGLFAHLVNQPAFGVLRTQEQLGYIVSSYTLAQVNTIAMAFRIQSEKPALFVDNRIEAFLENYKEVLRTMKLDDFARQKQGLVDKLRERMDNLDQESSRFGLRILDGTYDFSLRERTAAAVEKLTKVDILDFFIKYISPSSPNRSKLAIHVNSQIKPGTTINFSVAAAQVFLQDLKAAQVPVNEPQYHALSKAEPSVDAVIGFWSPYLDKLPNISAEKKEEILARIKVIAKLHPKESKGNVEGKMRDGTVVIEDLAVFRKGLEMSKPETPVIPLVVEEIPPDGVNPKL